MVQVGCTINYDRSGLWKARKKSVAAQLAAGVDSDRLVHMSNLLSLYFTLYIPPSLVRAAIIVACIVIGLTVRLALLAQPGTRFHSYWRLFFKKHSAKN
jgi:hypothetical protein